MDPSRRLVLKRKERQTSRELRVHANAGQKENKKRKRDEVNSPCKLVEGFRSIPLFKDPPARGNFHF